MTNWGQTLRDLMKEQKVSQRQLEAASGVSRSTIKRYVSGNSSPQIDVVEELLAALGYSITMGKTGEPSPLLRRKPKIRFPRREPIMPKLIKAAGHHRGG